MDIVALAKAHNRKAKEQNWHHFCDPTLAFSAPRYNQLVSIWRAKAGGRIMPRRSEMTARDLKDFLRDLLLVQRESVNPSRYSWRLIGTGITEVVGHHTGKSFEETIPPHHLARWVETSDMFLDSGQPWRVRGRVHIQGREYLDAENLYLPLANESDEPAFIMGLCRYTPHVTDNANYWEEEIASLAASF